MFLRSEYPSKGYVKQAEYDSCDYNTNGSSMQMMPNYRCPDYPKPQMYTENYHAYSNPTMHHQHQESNKHHNFHVPNNPHHGYDYNYSSYSNSGYGSKPAGMHGGNTSHAVPLSYHKPMRMNEERYEQESLSNGYGRGYNYDEVIEMQNPRGGVEIVRKGIENPDE